jgi:hypothetical protein
MQKLASAVMSIRPGSKQAYHFGFAVPGRDIQHKVLIVTNPDAHQCVYNQVMVFGPNELFAVDVFKRGLAKVLE